MATGRVERLTPPLSGRDEPTLGFGKYATWPLRSIPPTYMYWLLAQAWLKNRDLQTYRRVREIAVGYLKVEALTE